MEVPLLSPENHGVRHGDQRAKVEIREITLRELSHMYADLSIEEKIYWLLQLSEAGVARTALWGDDPDVAELVTRARDAGSQVQVELFGKTYFPEEARETITTAKNCGAGVCFATRSGPYIEKMGWTAQQVIDQCVEAINVAKDNGVYINIILAYATQNDLSFVREFFAGCAEAGVDCVCVADSHSVGTPPAMQNYVRAAKEAVKDIPVEVHCHNDFNLSLANALAAVEAGASRVDAIVNGLDPNGAGLTSFEEVVTALELLYGVDTGIDLARLTALSRLHQQMTGIRVPDNKAIVGRRAFGFRVAAGPVAGVPQRDTFYANGQGAGSAFDPAVVGNLRLLTLGKYSTENEVLHRLNELSLPIPEDGALRRIVAMVQDRGRSMKREVGDDELRYFVSVVTANGAH